MSPRQSTSPGAPALSDTTTGIGREPPMGHILEDAGRQVADIQRARMLSALVEVVAERGVANVSVAHVVARSGVSRRTFYEIFEDREDCFLVAFDDAIEKMAAVLLPAYEGETKWQERIRAGLSALLEFLDCEPDVGRLVIVETLGAGPRALERRRRVLAPIIAAVDEGRGEAGNGDGPPLLTAEGVVGAVLSVLHARLVEEQPGRLMELVGQLMGIVVLPYLGAAAARRELARAVPTPRSVSRRSAAADPLRDLEMRLTYRTVRVLVAVASNPGCSNRAVGEAAGMADQGQTSKLLARLQGLELVENIGGGPARGGPNAWTLTTKGWEVHATISAQMSSA
jgi:AcrR family transcriptional regulator